MSLEHVYVESLKKTLSFLPHKALLGSGLVGEVFKVTVADAQTGEQAPRETLALKRFLKREERDDFEVERGTSDALTPIAYTHIVTSIASWTDASWSYILFPLAEGGDLDRFLRHSTAPTTMPSTLLWISNQARGLCDALRCLHNYEGIHQDKRAAENVAIPIQQKGDTHKFELSRSLDVDRAISIGFHHDIKPANIVLFGTRPDCTSWKLCDFGSGTVKQVDSSSKSIYNRKASTGDPNYSAPEFIVDGRVSRPKDIWSLGCIFLEILTWLLDDSRDVVARFEMARQKENMGTAEEGEATFWNQQLREQSGVVLNPAVARQMISNAEKSAGSPHLVVFHTVICQMLTIDPTKRPKASELCHTLDAMIRDIKLGS